MRTQIPKSVADALGHYVYAYVDPRTEEIFYVGKGVGNRVLSHMNGLGVDTQSADLESVNREGLKRARLRELGKENIEPRIDFLAHNLGSDETALKVEAAIIDTLGVGTLTNQMSRMG